MTHFDTKKRNFTEPAKSLRLIGVLKWLMQQRPNLLSTSQLESKRTEWEAEGYPSPASDPASPASPPAPERKRRRKTSLGISPLQKPVTAEPTGVDLILQAATIDRAPVVQLDLSCAESRKKAAYAIGKAAHPSFLAQAVRNNLSSTESTKAMHDAMQHTATELLEDQVQPEYMAFNAGLLFGGAGFNARHQNQQASCLLTANGAASRAAMHGEGRPYTDVWQASNGAQLNRTTHSANAQLLHHHIGVTSGRSFEDRRKNSGVLRYNPQYLCLHTRPAPSAQGAQCGQRGQRPA